MDPLWQGLSRARSPFVFLDLWQANEFREPLFLGLLLSTAALAAGEESRRLWWSALGVLCAGMGLAFMALHWPAVLVVQMQPWRVLWLAKILAIAAATVLARDAWSTSAHGRILVAALLACALAVDGTGLLAAVPLLLLLVAARRLAIEPRRLPAGLVWSAWAVIALLIGERIFSAAQLSTLPLDFAAADFRQAVRRRSPGDGSPRCSLVRLPAAVGRRLVVDRPLSAQPPLAGSRSCWQLVVYRRALAARRRQPGRRRPAPGRGSCRTGANHSSASPDLLGRWIAQSVACPASRQLRFGKPSRRRHLLATDGGRGRASAGQSAPARSGGFGFRERVPTAPAQSSKRPTTVDDLVHACHDPILDFVVLLQPVPGATPMTVVSLYPSGPDYRVYACAPLRAVPDPFPAQR
jgi:hypothetical protein